MKQQKDTDLYSIIKQQAWLDYVTSLSDNREAYTDLFYAILRDLGEPLAFCHEESIAYMYVVVSFLKRSCSF